MKFRVLRVVLPFVLMAVTLGQSVANPETIPMAIDAADSSVFHRYLADHGLTERWVGEPTPLTSDEIRSAYPGYRFYFAFKNPPPPPGAPMPELLAAHEQAMEEYRKHSLRLTVGIDEAGHLQPLRTPEDFGVGLRPVKSDGDARNAAAAILSLVNSDEISPAVISAREVIVTKTGGAWICRVSQKPRGIDGEVTFDSTGHCTGARKGLNYSRPLPP